MKNIVKLALIGIAVLIISAGTVYAFPSGATGYSQTGCSPCHGASADPQTSVTITGIPAQYEAGTTYLLTVNVTSTSILSTYGGFDLSATDGTLSTSDPNAKISNGEATHKNNNARSWQVNWTAPAGPATVTFYVAGVASSNSGTSGSAWAKTSYSVPTIPEFSTVSLLIAFAAASMIALVFARKKALGLFKRTL